MTLEGTNTWLLSEPDALTCVVVDPGPLIEAHLQAVVAEAGARAQRITRILLTHGHADHAEGAARLAALTGAPVQALDPAHRLGGEGLHDGDAVEVDGLEIRVIGTPGHTADSLCFLLPADAAVLTGDTILGRGTTVVAYPDGRLDDYLSSLQRLRALAQEHLLASVLPGHGPVLDDPLRVLDFYLAHRKERLEQVASALAEGAQTPADVVRRVYADVDPALWPAAELSVRAQLDYLSRGDHAKLVSDTP
jgi:glyoxylase-like metal-dependent hydrolase (beta-lactamase superfamily II)